MGIKKKPRLDHYDFDMIGLLVWYIEKIQKVI